MPCCPEDEKELPPYFRDERDEKSIAYGWRAVHAACGVDPDTYKGISINKVLGKKERTNLQRLDSFQNTL